MRFVWAAAMAVLGWAAAGDAGAQGYPVRPVRLVVPFPAGGTTDIFARLVADKLGGALGQQFVIENRGGAGGNIGADAVAKSPSDGYTLVMGTVGTHAINSSLYTRMPYDPERDFDPVAFVAGVPNLMVVNPNTVKATSVAEFIAEAKAGSRRFNMASSGNGTSIHLSGEMFKTATGVEMPHVPYRGSGPAINDLVGGQVDVMFDNLPSCIEQVRAGNLRALAVTSAIRSPAIPTAPALQESGLKDFDATSWFAIFAPKGTSKDIVTRLNAEVVRALAEPDLKARFADLGGDIRLMTPEQLGAFQRAERIKWAEAVKGAGARLD